MVPSHRKSYSCEVEGGFNVYLGGQGYLEFLIDGIPINKPKGVVNGSITVRGILSGVRLWRVWPSSPSLPLLSALVARHRGLAYTVRRSVSKDS